MKDILKIKETEHPGKLLFKKMKSNNITQQQLANAIKVSVQTINKLITGKSNVTPNIALRLAVYFKENPRNFIKWQTEYDLYIQYEKIKKDLKQVKEFKK